MWHKKIDEDLFNDAMKFAEDVFPLHRSISGVGINAAFDRLLAEIGGSLSKYKTGQVVFDWEIPDEWECKGLSISRVQDDGSTERAFITLDHPLRVASHSIGFTGEVRGAELLNHLIASEKYPDNLSHRYVYYKDDWKVSVTRDEFDSIKAESLYFVDLRCKKYEGVLQVHEKRIGNLSGPVIFFLSHLCHPAQFNDGLIGVLLNVYLVKYIERYFSTVRHCYSFLAFPETIGSHAYCSNRSNTDNALFAIFSEMTGLDQPIHVQKSRDDDDYVNRIITLSLNEVGLTAKFGAFLKVIRNDEKVFNAPGIDIPAASITRALGPGIQNHPYWGYHTDIDTIEYADIDKLKEIVVLYQSILGIVEKDYVVRRCFSGIPMLSRHDLFVDPLVDRAGYNLRESLAYALRKDKKVSSIAAELDVAFGEVFLILQSWEESGLVEFIK